MGKFNNKFNSLDERYLKRKQNIREEKKTKEDLPKIVFSFKDFDKTQIPPGQLHEEWQKDKLLAYMLEKFNEICKCNIVEALQQNMIKLYDGFPEKSEFRYPKTVIRDERIKWAVIMNIKGQKPRVAGHIIDNVFYVVFLDKEHKFFPSELRNT
jgi:hypothetical protein